MKKIKNNKGIALVSLTIAIIILIVLTSMLVYNAKNGIKMRTLKMMQNDIDLLSDQISAYYVKYGDIPAEIEYLGPINFEKQPNDDDKYYVIDLSAFEDITLNYGLDYNNITSSADTQNYNDVYIVNKQSRHVYYARGLEMDGIMYYTNDEDEKVKLIGDRTGLKVGDYVDYVPDENATGYTADKLKYEITGSMDNRENFMQGKQYARDGEGMTWQILRIYEDGTIDLIGSSTEQGIFFCEIEGYNNGVTVMNDICKTLYSNEKLNAEARSVNYEDLENWLTDKGKTVRNTYSDYEGGPTYGHTQTYTENKIYPELFEQEKWGNIDSGLSGLTAGIDKEKGKLTGLGISDGGKASGYGQANSTLTATQTYWKGEVNNVNFGEGSEVLRTDDYGSYWLASRYTNCQIGTIVFGLDFVDDRGLYGNDLCDSTYLMYVYSSYCLRPVVTLRPSIVIENCTGENSVDNMHKIKY